MIKQLLLESLNKRKYVAGSFKAEDPQEDDYASIHNFSYQTRPFNEPPTAENTTTHRGSIDIVHMTPQLSMFSISHAEGDGTKAMASPRHVGVASEIFNHAAKAVEPHIKAGRNLTIIAAGASMDEREAKIRMYDREIQNRIKPKGYRLKKLGDSRFISK